MTGTLRRLVSAALVLAVLHAPRAAASASAVISEVLAVNGSGLEDGDGDRPDWIELHNPTAQPVDLGGHHLTDDPDDHAKWRLPAPLVLNPGGFLVVFASGKDRTAGGELHANFRLSGDGEFLALVAPDGVTVLDAFAPAFPRQFTDVSYGRGVGESVAETRPLVAAGSTARFHVPIAGEPEGGTGWRLPGYDDSGWPLGRSPFGFGYPGQPIGPDGDLAPFMHDPGELVFHGGVYLRFPFEIDEPARVVGMTLRMKYDDGFAAWLNGVPVASANAPDPTAHDSVATDSTEVGDADPWEAFSPAFAGHLVPGTNVLALHGLNRTHGGSDFLISAELDARIRQPSGGVTVGYFETPTPGAPNGTAVPGFIRDTRFSVDRGFFDAPFQLAITTETDGAEIRFTTDGTEPTESHGTVYTGPITIDRTTVVRAAAFSPGLRPTNVDTQTYLFPEDVVRQPDTGGLYWDTAMDPNVVDSPGTFSVAESLAAIPTLSIVMDPEDLFGRQGIYSNATQRASDNPIWERRCSVEYFYHPDYDGPYRIDDGFHIDCGVSINGNFSRLSHNPKHSLRLRFKRQFGPAKLEFPVFPDSPVDEFDTLAIRTGHNQGWATGHASTQMLRNQYARDLQGVDPAAAVADGNHIHLYLNGQYWGLYNFHERPDDSFAAEHWGGHKEDYDGFKGLRAGGSSRARILAGDRDAWSSLFALADRDLLEIANYHAVLELVDVDQLIDYMIGVLYTGDRDGPTGLYPPAEQPKNFYALRRRHEDGRFRFFRWDSEFIFEGTGVDVSERGGPENPAGLHKRLRRSPEYRLRFADHVHRHFFNGGAFTPEAQKAAYLRRAAQISVAMVAESARWGDAKREPPFTRDGHWVAERDRIVDAWMPARHAVVISQFRADGLYPDVEAPVFTVAGAPRHGGPVAGGAALAMRAAEGTVYFTTDGTDPRTPDAPIEFTEHVLVDESAAKRAIVPADPEEVLDWTDPSFDDAAWPTGTAGAGFEFGSGYEALIDPALDFAARQDVLADETIAMRIAFDIEDPSVLDTLILLVRYDDGFVAHLNGIEIARDRTLGPPDSPVAFDEPASESHDDALAVEFQAFDVSEHLPVLRPGRNVLAVQGLNFGTSSSDFLLWPKLVGQEILSGTFGDVPSPSAVAYQAPVILDSTGPIKARTLREGRWSALSEAHFLVDSEPAGPGNLVVSEIHYHPAAPTEAEVAEGYDSRKDFEWIELLAVGGRTVDLAGAAFTSGIRFDFDRRSTIRHLEPGHRLLVAKNREALLFRHPELDPALVAGEFGLRLGDGGETLALRAADGTDVVRFAYGDDDPWPEAADGAGHSLVLRDPESRPQPGDPRSWRASGSPGGSPGADDRHTLAGWLAELGFDDPDGDPDGNGISHLMHFAFGRDEAPRVEGRRLEIDGTVGDFLVLSWHVNPTAMDVGIDPEMSTDLETWSPLPVVELSRSPQADGTIAVTARTEAPVTPGARRYVRLHIGTNEEDR